MSVTSPGTPASATGQAIDAWRAWIRAWSTARDYPALLRLSREADTLAAVPGIEQRLLPVRVAILSSATADFFLPILKASLFRAGLRPSVYVAPYGQVTTSLLDPDSPLTHFRPQVTIVTTATAHLPGWPALDAPLEDVQRQVDEVCRSLLEPSAVFMSARDQKSSSTITRHSPGERLVTLAPSCQEIRRRSCGASTWPWVIVHLASFTSTTSRRSPSGAASIPGSTSATGTWRSNRCPSTACPTTAAVSRR